MSDRCPVCGSPVTKDSNVCNSCGSSLSDPDGAGATGPSPAATVKAGGGAGVRKILIGFVSLLVLAGAGLGLFYGGRAVVRFVVYRTGTESAVVSVVSGSVLDGYGRPREGLRVVVDDGEIGAITDSTGRFEIADVPLGSRISVRISSDQSVEPESVRLRDDRYVRFVVYNAVAVRGEVSWGGLLRIGEPVANVRVRGMGVDGRTVRTRTDSSGVFSLTGVREGTEIKVRRFFTGSRPSNLLADSEVKHVTMRSWWRFVFWILGLFVALLIYGLTS